jgi:hypothetical protein
MQQVIPEWYVKFVKGVFLAFGLAAVGKLAAEMARQAKDAKEQPV